LGSADEKCSKHLEQIKRRMKYWFTDRLEVLEQQAARPVKKEYEVRNVLVFAYVQIRDETLVWRRTRWGEPDLAIDSLPPYDNAFMMLLLSLRR
jgi:hypothetical protein